MGRISERRRNAIGKRIGMSIGQIFTVQSNRKDIQILLDFDHAHFTMSSTDKLYTAQLSFTNPKKSVSGSNKPRCRLAHIQAQRSLRAAARLSAT